MLIRDDSGSMGSVLFLLLPFELSGSRGHSAGDSRAKGELYGTVRVTGDWCNHLYVPYWIATRMESIGLRC